ncbi:MAG TPA: 6,7-dimethyl-8-ribityllumazine synthase [Anaeromyxobacteraceae bacterium]|nr:6,7-dimethyl-8-ribityllumazine synthase [Anaeromyxobacteraceae bacterium]
MNVYEGSLVATGLRFAVVVARFNSLVTEQLLAGAVDALRRHGVDDGAIDVYRCPGTFELPALLKRVALSGRYDGAIALGAVIRGGTPHFEYVAAEASKGVGVVALEASCAVSFGILTCDTLEQALERAGVKSGNKGADAAMAAIEQANAFKAASGRAGKRTE